MKPIKYFLLFVTALCVSQWKNLGRPQRGFGPRIPNNQNNGFDSNFSNNPNNGFNSRFLNSIGIEPRFTNQKNSPIPQAEVQDLDSMDFNGENLQLPEQQLQALFNPLFEQLIRIEQKLNNNEQLTEQQIFNLLILMPELAELQPIFKELTALQQRPQEQQRVPFLPQYQKDQIQQEVQS